VGSAAGMILGLLPRTKKNGEDLRTIYVPDGTMNVVVVVVVIIPISIYCIHFDYHFSNAIIMRTDCVKDLGL
jgi:hypothetical protein